MKKRLFLLPLFAGLALSSCSFEDLMFWKKKSETPSGTTPSGGGSVTPSGDPRKDPKAPTADLTIDISVLGEFFDEGYTYPQDDYSFTLETFKFDATSGVGQKTPEQSGGNYYNEQGALQFRKANHEKGGGVISNYDPIIASQITIHWFATYASEAKQYQPVVKAAESADAVAGSTALTAAEGATVSGTKTDGKQSSGSGTSKKDYDVYAYTTTYDISGKNFFSIGAPNGAMYVKDIVINK